MKIVKPGSTALWPVPVVLVSCGIENPNIITLAWVGTVCSQPPSVGIAVRPERHSHSLIMEAGEFVVNLPSVDQVGVVDYCGQVSGRDVDKWKECNLSPAPSQKIRTPLVQECAISLECSVTNHVEVGAHDLFIGEVVAVQMDEDVLTAEGRVDYERARLMAYAGGYYWQLGELLGRFGDWRAGAS